YIIIGGGPTGVEMAGAIADAINYTFRREFRNIKLEDTLIIIIEAASGILGGMPQPLATYAKRVLGRKGVRVECGTTVQDIKAGRVFTNKGIFHGGTIFWAAGVKPLPIADWLGVETNKRGTITVTGNLSLEN